MLPTLPRPLPLLSPWAIRPLIPVPVPSVMPMISPMPGLAISVFAVLPYRPMASTPIGELLCTNTFPMLPITAVIVLPANGVVFANDPFRVMGPMLPLKAITVLCANT